MSRFNFNLDKPSGSLARDLDLGKRVELRRGQNTKVERVESDKRVIRFVCSTDGVKRDGNRLRNDGWDLESFSKNPVMLWSHDYSQPPVGSWEDWKVVKDGEESALVMTARFADYDFAQTVYKLYVDGHMRAVSIGWTPLEYDKLEDDDGNFVGFDFLKNELLECSAVPIPADPDALMQATARGLITGEELDRFAQATRVGDISRGEAYVLDHRGLRQENRMAIVINEKATEWAAGAIEKGEYESSEEWTWSDEDAKFLLDGGDGEDWSGYSFHFLGRDEDQPEDSLEGWSFPIGKRREDGVVALYATALELAIESSEDESIVAAATGVLEELRARDDAEDGEEAEVEDGVEVEEEVEGEGEGQRDGPMDLSLMYDSLVAHIKGVNLPAMELWKSIKSYQAGEEGSAEAVETGTYRVGSMLAAALDIASEMAEQVGGEGTEGGGAEGGGADGEPSADSEILVEVEDSGSSSMSRIMDALGDYGTPDIASANGDLSESDITMLAHALGHAGESDWEATLATGDETRIGKKVSRKRVGKIVEASRSVMDAYRKLEEVLEDIGGSDLLSVDEAEDDAVADEDSAAESGRSVAPKVAKPEPKLEKSDSRMSDQSLESRIEALSASLGEEDERIARSKIDEALRSLAKKLDLDVDKTYVDEIL